MNVTLIDDKAGPAWDTLSWDDTTLIQSPEARALFTKMVAQSLNDWVAYRQALDARKRHTEEGVRAMLEVENELRERGPVTKGPVHGPF